MAKHIMRVVPSTRSILADYQAALAHEASRLAHIANERTLNDKEAKRLHDGIKALALVSQEEARQRNQDILAGMSDTELQALLADLVAKNPDLLPAPNKAPERTELTSEAFSQPNPIPARPKLEEPLNGIRHSER